MDVQSESGATTILFTDIEGSTRLWEQQPERMSRALAQHDALARAAVQGHGGVVVKMIGDGMYAAFADPVDGVKATLDLQEALADPAATDGVPLRIRCGLHLGPVERRDNDFFGPPVNRSARIMGAAHGGQILVSQAVVDELQGRLPSEVSLRDLGGVRLKDLASPERVYQVVHPKLRQDFPALRSLESTPNNLPQQLTSFVGRERELAEAGALLRKARLLSLLGMGGLGKTRLSLQIAADALDSFPDGAWFIDLAPIKDTSLIPREVAKILGLQEEPGRALLETLCTHVKSRKLLLILDNCEHLVSACAILANAMLQCAPDVRIIATSREALRVPGEQTYPVLPLPVPSRTASLEVIEKSDAVQLFLDRARLHKAGYTLTERDAPAVAELCSRLEGIPLALELAAARMRALSVADINTRLRDRFKLLTGGGRVLLERQQTLRALVDWSYDLLQENERVLFERLGVFAGGFDLAACEEVCGTDPLDPLDVLDRLTSLVDKSLVVAEELDDGTRYRTLETIREYAREKLTAREEFAPTAGRHCSYYLGLAKTASRGLEGAEQWQWTHRLETDLDNLRAATALALEGGVDPIIAVKIEVALMNFRILRGYVTEGRKYVRAALALPAVQASNVAHAWALYAGAALATSQSDHAEAATMLEACLALRRDLGNAVDIAATLSTLALVRLHAGDTDSARQGEEEALQLFRQQGDKMGEAVALIHLGQICATIGEDDEARSFIESGTAIGRAIKHCEIESEGERMLGEIALGEGDVVTARNRFLRALTVCRDAGNRKDEAASLWCLGRAALTANEPDKACEQLEAALRAFRAFEMHEETLGCLEDHARLAQSTHHPEAAARLFSAAAGLRRARALHRSARDEARWLEDVATTRKTLGDAAFERLTAEARDWEMDDAVQYALSPKAQVAAGEAVPA